jgi:hypothetical protein
MNFMTKIGLVLATTVTGYTIYYVNSNIIDDIQNPQQFAASEIAKNAGESIASEQSLSPNNVSSENLVAQKSLTVNAQPTQEREQHLDNQLSTIEDASVALPSSSRENFKANLCANQGESKCLIYDVTQVENQLVVSDDTMHLNKAMVVLDSQNLEELIDYMNATASIAEQEYTEKFNQRLAGLQSKDVTVSPIACGNKICFLTMTYQDKEAWESFSDELFFGDDAISYNIGQKPQKPDASGNTEVRYFFSYDPNLRRFISI